MEKINKQINGVICYFRTNIYVCTPKPLMTVIFIRPSPPLKGYMKAPLLPSPAQQSTATFRHKDALSTPASQVTPEVIPSASRTKGSSYSDDDDIESMGNDSSYENSEHKELPHPPPEVVEEVFSSMIDSIPRTKEEVVNWFSDEDGDDGEDEH